MQALNEVRHLVGNTANAVNVIAAQMPDKDSQEYRWIFSIAHELSQIAQGTDAYSLFQSIAEDTPLDDILASLKSLTDVNTPQPDTRPCPR